MVGDKAVRGHLIGHWPSGQPQAANGALPFSGSRAKRKIADFPPTFHEFHHHDASVTD